MAIRTTIGGGYPDNMSVAWFHNNPKPLPPMIPMTAIFFQYHDTAANGAYTSDFMYTSSVNDYDLVCFYSALHTPVDFAIGIDGFESFSGIQITGRWLAKAVRTSIPSSIKTGEYFFDLPNLSRKVTTTSGNAQKTVTSNYSIMLGTNPYTSFEGNDGRQGGIKIFKCYLPDAALIAESKSIYPVLKQYRKYLWTNVRCGNKSDLLDLSGNGNHARIYSPSGTQPTNISDGYEAYRTDYRKDLDYDTYISTANNYTSTPSGVLVSQGSLSGFVKLPKFTCNIG